MRQDSPYDFTVQTLGEGTIDSPLNVQYFTSESKRILFNIEIQRYADLKTADGAPLSVEVAGPRQKIFFDPAKTRLDVSRQHHMVAQQLRRKQCSKRLLRPGLCW